VDEARGHPPGGKPSGPVDHRGQQGHGPVVRPFHTGIILRDHMVDQGRNPRLALEEGMPLERAEPDVAMGKPDQHRTPRRAGLVAPDQLLSCLDQREGP
jgi:hypothetical protein